MRGSIKKIQELLKEEKLDAFLVLEKINRQYLSGFTGSAGILLISKTGARLFVDGRYFLRAKKETKLPVYELKQHSHILKNVRMLTVGVEDRISLRQFDSLKKRFRKVSWKVTHDVVESLRLQKTHDEIGFIRKGSRIIDQVFEGVKRVVRGKKGISEAEVAFFIEKQSKLLGADGLAFDPIVAFGPNAAIPHHSTSTKKVGRNNFLLLDFGFKVNGYHSDFTRTLFIGRPNKEQERVYQTVLNAQALGIKSVKIGQKAALVHSEVFGAINKARLGKFFTHSSGHGVGLEIHELPNLSMDSADILTKGSVLTVEPGIYLPGKFGIRIEDMVWVKEGPEILSGIGKEFKDMIIK